MRSRFAVPLLSGLLLLWLLLLPVANRLGRRLQERTDEVETQRSELARLLAQERDTTQRLAEVNELKDSFLTAVSHELRTPLTVVRGMLSTLRRHGSELSAERRQHLLDRADNSAEKLGDLLGGLLTLNGQERSRSQSYATLDLDEAVAEVRSHFPPHDLELALDASTVTADPFGLERILANLLGNALRHAPDGPVRIESEEVAGGVELRVADRGPGVPDDLKQAVYEPFRQGELHDRHSPGTGIGLALVARFVADHGGCTWVGDRPGGGAVFHVRLPDDPSPHEPIGPQAAVCSHDHGVAAVVGAS
jgi:signal transduction histidine kinase